MFSALHKKAFCHEGLCLAHLFWLDNSTDRIGRICIVNLPTKKSVVCMSLFCQDSMRKINYCNIMRKTCYSDRCSPYVVSDWDLGDDLNCCRRTPSQEVCTLNAPSSIFAEGFQLLSLDEIHQSCRSESSSLSSSSGSKERRTSGLLWFPSNLDCMNAIKQSRAQIFQKQ